MTQNPVSPDAPALDELEDNPDLLVGEEVEPEHDVNLNDLVEDREVGA